MFRKKLAGLFGCILLLRELNAQFLIHQHLVGHMSRSLDLDRCKVLDFPQSVLFFATVPAFIIPMKQPTGIKFKKDISLERCLRNLKIKPIPI